MIIDFHVHAFPDKIAKNALDKISKDSGGIKYYTTGNVGGTKAKLKECGIDLGVILPIATAPSQETTINNWASTLQGDGVVSFGSVHPDSENAVREIYRIKELGIKGVKLHPEYQTFCLDEPKMYPIYETLSQLGLPLVVHGGWDPISPNLSRAKPSAARKVIEDFPQLTLVVAHMGGLCCYDEAETYLVGKNVYFDLAMAYLTCEDVQLKRMIRNHGADKILFGSDSPWSEPSLQLQQLERLGLTTEENDLILCGNAKRLLNL